jgi:transcription-repair coupling factor (superfamily II helicase)
MMNDLLAHISRLDSFTQLVDTVAANPQIIKLGLIRSARLPIAAALSQTLQRNAVLLSHRRDRAINHFDELELWLPDAVPLYFPEPSSLFYENAPWSETARRERLATLAGLKSSAKSSKPFFLSSSIRALMAKTIPESEFSGASFQLFVGQSIEPIEFSKQLVQNGYESAHSVTAAGFFARRGGLIDVWPMQLDRPVRIEFFGDSIESMRLFDAATQRSVGKIESSSIPPAREFLSGSLDERAEESYSEFHIPVLHPQAGIILDYIDAETLVFVDDKEAILASLNEYEQQSVEFRKQAIEQGQLDADFPIPYFSTSEIEDLLASKLVIEFGQVGRAESDHALSNAFRPGRRFGGKLKDLNSAIGNYLDQGEDVFVHSRQAVRLQELWEEEFWESEKTPQFTNSNLGSGWSLESEGQKGIHFLTDSEIFGWDKAQIRRRPRLSKQAPESSYLDLRIGETVVHIDHGVGIFKGLVKRDIEDVEREFLQIGYGGDDQLYVPVHQADRVTRYVGARGDLPQLSRLGGAEWRTVKSKVRKAVEAIAEDLLELYAKRESVRGHSFQPDSAWQKELEASFPYMETPDQLRVMAEVKADMEADQPMDRLVCGDAGYGKTEIALRAAFKAVMDGKQVALLVPTTVLAQQHFETFSQRLAAFPVRVEMLSRFRTPSEQRIIVNDIAADDLDIVIGTHRMIQQDVVFKDLGLLIIDEEQRFGVSHKEYLKKMRTEVDVMTMTATPIPRTLYMALTGVRDISTISTPPEERLPVVTHVGPYSPDLVRQAILRELDRGGQIFFVHNRVQTISAIHARLSKLVPEARISIAHGQMKEGELAKCMHAFNEGDIDVLLSTTIIESGLDIPNANTLIIDRADTFGLSQLYQLRGRVGRGAQRAFAYFFKHAQRAGSEEGRQRLETIAENTQLGAGFTVAMRDLEIRGAGDLLGTRQHGLISAVGFHLYTRLLTKAVEDIRKSGALGLDQAATQITLYHPMINVDLPHEVGIPENYVPGKGMRLKLYRRLADMHDSKEIDAIEEEFNDRFGVVPEETANLLFQLKIKVLAEKAGLSSIAREGNRLALRFPENSFSDSLKDASANSLRKKKTKQRAIWLQGVADQNWKEPLLDTLKNLSAHQ